MSKGLPTHSAIAIYESVKRDSYLLCTSIIVIAFLFVWAIATVVMGAVYHGQCPVQTNIPIFLIVNGTISAIGNGGILISVCIDIYVFFS
jgi:hypothetical protein